MKPIYNPAPTMFVRMKEQPPDDRWYPDRYNNGEWWCFWGKKGTDVVNKIHLPEFKPPYRPGEKCCVAETWRLIFCACSIGNVIVESSYEIHYKDGTFREIEWKGERGTVDPYVKHFDIQRGYPGSPPSWNSPVLMPEILARRFVTIVSCEPVQKEGEWWWRVETEGEK